MTRISVMGIVVSRILVMEVEERKVRRSRNSSPLSAAFLNVSSLLRDKTGETSFCWSSSCKEKLTILE